MKTLLIIDNDPVTLHLFVGLLKSQGGFLRILSAPSIRAAVDLLAAETVHIVIVGMHMTEMDTFDLLIFLEKTCPQTRVFVMTNSASPMFRTKIRQMPAVVHFDQVLDISMLPKRIFTELQIDYGGQIRGISLASFLQMVELERRSCTLQITAKGKTGTITLVDGKPVGARTGLLSGKPAAIHILTWSNVWIDIDYAPREVSQEIATPLMNLLLESGRIVDEKQSQRPNLRKHPRYDCLAGVDYRIGDFTYQCQMRDISEGGAYIETEHPIQMGQRLTLSLSSPALEILCTIDAKVVRRDARGVALEFDALTLDQRQAIRSLLDLRCTPVSGGRR